MFAAGAGHIGDYSHCSWSVTGTGQFLPHEGASPAIGTVGSVEQVAEERVEVIAPARLRGHVLAALRTAHPYEEPAFDVLELASVAAGRRHRPNRCAADAADVVGVRLSRARRAARHVVGGSGVGRGRRRGVAGGGVRRGGRLASRRRRGRGRACLRDGRPAAPSRRRTPAALRRRAGRRRALGERISVVRSGGRRCFATTSGTHLPVRVIRIRTDPWNIERKGL